MLILCLFILFIGKYHVMSNYPPIRFSYTCFAYNTLTTALVLNWSFTSWFFNSKISIWNYFVWLIWWEMLVKWIRFKRPLNVFSILIKHDHRPHWFFHHKIVCKTFLINTLRCWNVTNYWQRKQTVLCHNLVSLESCLKGQGGAIQLKFNKIIKRNILWRFQ